jgi:hypothetical protein
MECPQGLTAWGMLAVLESPQGRIVYVRSETDRGKPAFISIM